MRRIKWKSQTGKNIYNNRHFKKSSINKRESSLDRLKNKMNVTEERVSEHENRTEKCLSLKNREKMGRK